MMEANIKTYKLWLGRIEKKKVLELKTQNDIEKEKEGETIYK